MVSYKKRCLFLLLMTVFPAISSFSYAKPMNAPTFDEGLKAKYIVIAEYIRYIPEQKADYFSGVTAQYRVGEVLKGPSIRGLILLNYSFHDGSACTEPENWSFNNEQMPKPNSHWILFLFDEKDGRYSTYRGNYGRCSANDDNLANVKSKIGNSLAYEEKP